MKIASEIREALYSEDWSIHGLRMPENAMKKKVDEIIAAKLEPAREAIALSIGWLDDVCDPEHEMHTKNGIWVRGQIEDALAMFEEE